MGEPFFFAGFQVWQLRPSEEGGPRLMSAAGSQEAQEAELSFWLQKMPDALLVYRTRQEDGTYLQELHLDRTLKTIPK